MAMSMKDELIDLLRDRFSGHEMEVPNGVWENVSGQLASSASGEGLRETLQEKFQAHEVEVDPSVWSNISTQLGHGAAAGSSFSTAWIAAGITAVVITAGAILWNTHEKPAPVVADPIGTVTQEPVAVLTPEPKKAPEPATSAAVASTKPEHTSVKKAARTPASPVVAQQPVQQTPAPANSEAHKDASSPAVKSITSGTPNAPLGTQPSTVRPPAPNVPQQELPTPTAKDPVTVDPAAPAQDGTEDQSNHATSDPSSPAPQGTNGDDPFTKTDTFNMFFPNTFTPNGDGDNDEFGIIAGPHLNALVQIFSMNGSLVFQTNDLSQWWNGHLPNGNIAEEGSYTCIVQITDLDGKTHVKKKVINLYRTLNP